MFEWFKFVEDVEVVFQSETQIKYLVYKEINIYPQRCGLRLFAGAFKYSKESAEDRSIIMKIEDNGITIHGIVSAIEEGLAGREKPSLDLAQYINNGSSLLRKAFEKGLSLRKEAEEVFKKDF